MSTPMAGTSRLATVIRPHLFSADFSTGAFVTTPVGDVAAAALALVSLSSLRGRVNLPIPFSFRSCSISKSTGCRSGVAAFLSS